MRPDSPAPPTQEPPPSPYRQSVLRRLRRGGLWSGAGTITKACMVLLTNMVVARLVSPAELGVYFLALSLAEAAAVLAVLGLDNTCLRMIADGLAKDHGQPVRAMVRTTLVVGGLGAIVVAALLVSPVGGWLATRLFGFATLAKIMTAVGLYSAVLALRLLTTQILRAFHDIRGAALYFNILPTTVPFVVLGGAWLLRVEVDVLAVLSMLIVASLLADVLAGRKIWAHTRGLNHSGGGAGPGELRRLSATFWLSNVIWFFMGQADLWIVAVFLSETEAAIYGAGLMLARVLHLPLIVVNGVIPPIVAELHSQRRTRELRAVLRGTATLAAIPAAIGFLVFLVAGADVLGLVFGPYFARAVDVLLLLSVGQLVGVLCGSCGYALQMTGGHRQTLLVIGISGALTVLAAIAVVETWGIVGVAAAAGAGLIVQKTLLMLLARRRLGIWTVATWDVRVAVRGLIGDPSPDVEKGR